MKNLLPLAGRSFSDIWADVWNALLVNLLWTFGMLLVIPGPPATLALFYFANRKARGEVVEAGDFWSCFWSSWGAGWRWGLIAYGVSLLLYGDYRITMRFTGLSGGLVQGLYLVLLIVWIMIQLYSLPFLFEQRSPSVLQALRNGAVMLGRNPFFTLALALLLWLILIAGTLLFMLTFVIGGLFIALLANYVVLYRLDTNSSAV